MIELSARVPATAETIPFEPDQYVAKAVNCVGSLSEPYSFTAGARAVIPIV